MSEANSRALRLNMINAQLRTCDVNDLDLLAAFSAVPRETYAAPAPLALVYADGEIASAWPKGRKLLSARTLGLLLKCAEPVAGEKALTVGGGAGYCAALLAALGLEVVELETETQGAPPAPAGVTRVAGPLDAPPAGGPFDVIVVNGAFEATPDKLIAALKDGGRLVGLGARTQPKRIVVFERSGGGVSERAAFDAAGDVLPGLARAPAFAF